MSEMACLHCGATTHNGLVLCELCQRKASTDLEFLPVYFRNLARWRPPARPNGSLSAPGQWMLRHGESGSNSITNALDQAGNDAATWAQCLADDRGIELPIGDDEPTTFALTCELLTAHLTSIGTLEWAGEFIRAIDAHERTLRGLTETMVPGWYAGGCKRRVSMATEQDSGLCGAPTYVVPGLTWVTCRACGTTTFARDHVETVLTEARGWVAPPRRIAEAVVALVDTELSVPRLHDRIRQWGSRSGIEVVRDSPYAPKRYRLGSVLDLLAREGATKHAEDVPADVTPEAV